MQAATIKNYVSGLNAIATAVTGAEPRTWLAVSMLIKGWENAGSPGRGRQKSDPVTFRILRLLKDEIKKKKWCSASKKVVWAACCVAYFGSFRLGELLGRKEQKFDRSTVLTWADLRAAGDGFSVKVKSPKSGRPEERVEIFRFPSADMCPVTALEKLREEQIATGTYGRKMPVFRLGSGKLLTKKNWNKTLAKLCQRPDLRGQKISGKSFRAGIPTDMEGRPYLAPVESLKDWGRWTSGAYRRYMKDNRKRKAWFYQKICSNLLN